MISYNFNYLYTKIPLSVFKVKIEERDKICVYKIHLLSNQDTKVIDFLKKQAKNKQKRSKNYKNYKIIT